VLQAGLDGFAAIGQFQPALMRPHDEPAIKRASDHRHGIAGQHLAARPRFGDVEQLF
jgi:hypothetical protein